MRKRECLYVHALCVLLRRELERRRDLPDGTFAAYEELAVEPTAVHRPKTDHQRAIAALLDALSTAADRHAEDSDALSVRRDGPN